MTIDELMDAALEEETVAEDTCADQCEQYPPGWRDYCYTECMKDQLGENY